MIDLRSDTVTKPTKGMLRAMTAAEVGDDVFGEDPATNAFQQKIADLFGMESGLFVPSGVMANQLALKILANPGEEVIIEEKGHIFNYETAAASLISSVQIHPVKGKRGKLNPELIAMAMRSGKDWEPVPSLVVVENTTNKGGGACYTKEELVAIRQRAEELNLLVHLDGARIWNAITATDIEASFFGSVADTITVSFSKGLGAPVGSMLLSSTERVRLARRYRKMLGGGMRQTGLLIAAADYALENHWPLIEHDHRRANELAKTLNQCKSLSINPETVETNIVIFDVRHENADSAVAKLEREDVRMAPFGPKTIRATFHHQISDEDLVRVQETCTDLFG